MEQRSYDLNFNAVVFPAKEMIVSCTSCNAELAREVWNSYHDYNRKQAAARKRFARCPKCKTAFKVSRETPTWETAGNGDLIAKGKNGDFCIWRYGNAFKWRYRTYGKQYADQIGFAVTKEYAKSMCERHKEWRL